MKILMSALACEPGKGSELEVGFRAMLAAASRHEVWVLTNAASIPAIREAIDGSPCAERVHLEGIEFEVNANLYPQLTVPGFHWYYDRWQRKAAVRAVELDRAIDFDIVHHATLAAYWTRTGVAAVQKPLVWGPVGGGVEPPPWLVTELGWWGVLEDAGRIVGRRLLARFGPARQARHRAVVIFAQNQSTLAKIRTRARTSVLTNAAAIDLRNDHVPEERTKDILFVGRLVAWKGPVLALRAFRYVRHGDARLIFCGEGYEQRRLERAAERWGIAGRVRFEGWLPRKKLLARLAGAGALLHPALHEEAGLCVAEALALGTPAICLDHGGPPEILREWPHTPSAAIRPAGPDATARLLARAIDRFLDDPPPRGQVPRGSVTSFHQELLSAYESARGVAQHARRRPIVWAFPRGKPQLFADSARALSRGVLIYAFGRRIPRFVQTGIALQVCLPGLRRLVAERRERIEPVCGWDVWASITDSLRQRGGRTCRAWLQLHSQWDKRRSSVIGLDARNRPEFFLTIEPADGVSRGPLVPVPSFRVPACTDSFRVADWSVRQYELLPQFHRPARWNLQRIRIVARDVSRALGGALQRPPDLPPHWQPIHGDLVPWNLREDDDGQLWLMDWEDAGWGPPLADCVRYVVAYHSLGWKSATRIATLIRSALAKEPPEALEEAARFWLEHRNFRPVEDTQGWTRQKARDAARWGRELAAFRVLTGCLEHSSESV